MHEALAPLEAELVEQDGEHLEVVVLLIADHVDHLVYLEVLEAELCRADVLRHVHARAVGAQEQFLVESLGGEVGPDGAVGLAEEDAALEALFHLLLALEVGVALVVYLVEAHAEGLVGLVEAGVDPLVHAAPQGAHLGVVLLPAHEHLAGFAHEGRLFLGAALRLFGRQSFSLEAGGELGHLPAVVAVEGHVVVAYEVVALQAGAFGRGAVAVFLPGEHRLADVYAAVVDYVGLDHAVAAGGDDLCERPSEQVVAHVAQVERLVGVGRGVFDHYQRRLVGGAHDAVLLVGVDFGQELHPAGGRHHEVEEALDHVEGAHARGVCLKPFADFAGGVFGLLAREAQQGECDEREVSLELALGLLQLYESGVGLLPVECLHGGARVGGQLLFYVHERMCFCFHAGGVRAPPRGRRAHTATKLRLSRDLAARRACKFASGGAK